MYGFPRWLGGYPSVFNSSFHKNDEGTDLITNHLRWNWEEIMHVLSRPVTHKRIAILREPVSSFVSAFNYFYRSHFGIGELLESGHRKWREPCVGSPYFQLLDSRENATISEFISVLNRTRVGGVKNFPWYSVWKKFKKSD